MDVRDLPLDHRSATRMAEAGLRLGLVDPTDPEAVAAWHEADARGFHGSRPDQGRTDELLTHASNRRVTAVFDDTIPSPEIPVATTASWVAGLTLPGGGVVDSWAISSVTVSPTHRRRGVARALLEGELRTASAAGVPMASLTVSEATLYGRYGFGPAARRGSLVIETKRAGWVGPQAPGRVAFVSVEEIRDSGRAVFDAARLKTPGEIDMDEFLWERIVGAIGDEKENSSLRAVRYDDADGVPQGFALYRMKEDRGDFTKHAAEIWYLRAVTDEAYAGLWHFLLDLPLVRTVRYDLSSDDEPVLWMLADARAARLSLTDHHWLRILDVPAVLGARTYGAEGALVLEVTDPLGLADGVFRLRTDADGRGSVQSTDALPELRLGVAELSALCLGGARAATLARAGRVAELAPRALARFDAAFRADPTPLLSYWY